MKAVIRFAIIGSFMAAALVSVPAVPKGKGVETAPGQADNFYRGVTTVGSTSTTETITSATVLSTETETRLIGGGQANNKKDGNLQDRTVSEVRVVVTEVTTVEVEAHRGAPVSNGEDLSYTEVTERVVSDTITTEIGDWGAAYDVPSEDK